MPGPLFTPFHRQSILSKRTRILVPLASSILLTLMPSNGWQTAIAETAAEPVAETSVPADSAEDMTDTTTPPPLDLESVQISPIRLLNVGVEPRHLFQFNPAVGTEQQSVMTLDMGGTMTTSGITQALPNTPTTTMVLATDVARMDEAGNRYINFEYTDVTVSESSELPPAAIEAIRSQLTKLEGLSGSWVINEQGHLSQFSMTPPEDMSAVLGQSLQQMVDSLQQLSAPFPTEAIGIGAQWEMPYNASMNGITMDGVATYELVSVEGDRITLNTTVTQQGTATSMSGLGLPESVELSAQQIESSGQGIIEMDLNTVMPIYSDMSLTSDSSFTVGHQGLEVPVSMNMLINMSLISE